ncbi:hypothetical protein [Spongiimicrobium sp. 3-5]|uniref:hypothetical protein n=1 Tax=Spongiimicrobium sp. 3-5 TaxID=3332596 RepID=UPI003980D4C3
MSALGGYDPADMSMGQKQKPLTFGQWLLLVAGTVPGPVSALGGYGPADMSMGQKQKATDF